MQKAFLAATAPAAAAEVGEMDEPEPLADAEVAGDGEDAEEEATLAMKSLALEMQKNSAVPVSDYFGHASDFLIINGMIFIAGFSCKFLTPTVQFISQTANSENNITT